ncbi:MAG: hypothetical protein ACYSU7_01005 [Planctomycetota bacterium]|jgi:hypothetical protein
MISRFCIPGALIAATAAATLSAAPPPRITHLADTSTLNEQQRQEIRNYAEYWCNELTAEDPAGVDEARGKLADPLVRPVRIGQTFRFTYADATLPHLEVVIEGSNPQAAVNAMQIAAMLGTPRALEMITRHASLQDEPAFGLRLWAAKTFPIAVGEKVLPPNEIDKALRQFGNAASRELNWLVLRRQFEAIASVKGNVSHDEQVRVLRATTDRMDEQEGPSDLMQATYPALKLILDEYLELQPDQQESFGKSLGPVLGDLVAVANKHWDSAQDDDVARVTYGGAIHISENLLRLIDDRVRPLSAGPRTELGPAWKNRQKTRFSADHDKWRSVLNEQEYRDP